MRILITGGAGFVGGAMAHHFRSASAGHEVVIFDNLRRRGSEWNVSELAGRGVTFAHGDVRSPQDLEGIEGNFDVLIEASAEPSVHAGIAGSPRYVLDTNLGGAINCLEFARQRCAGLVFLSSSRIFPIAALARLPLLETPTRLDLDAKAPPIAGASHDGIAEGFASGGVRSYYGASKLAAELLCQEYAAHSNLAVVIDRCGVIAGPGQFGTTDQGVFTLWVARHAFGRPLTYTGFGGKGLQVRDLLHPADLCELVERQIEAIAQVNGETFNIGGGRAGSVSLREFTDLCQAATGKSVAIGSEPKTRAVDVPWYVTDHARVTDRLGWRPSRPPQTIVGDIVTWLRANPERLASLIP